MIHSLGEDGDWHEGEPQLAHSPTPPGPPWEDFDGRVYLLPPDTVVPHNFRALMLQILRSKGDI